MNKKLYLLRHGKSDWRKSVSDQLRPLKERGIAETVRVGAWMKGRACVPDIILSSSAERAACTASIVCDAMAVSEERVILSEDLYMATEAVLLDFIWSTSQEVKALMVVGHNPGLEELLARLTTGADHNDEFIKILPTATVAGLEVGPQWSAAGILPSTLNFLQRGKLL